jgi:hypothetical protein
MRFCMVCFACIYVSSLAGGIMFSNTEHLLQPARLLTQMHEILPFKNVCTNCVRHGEHMWIETCKRLKRLN